jgi:outer membrane protein assembly complex protein YaeT
MAKKKWKKIRIAAAVAAIVIVLIVLIIQSPFVKKKILSSLQSSLQKTQGIELTVESFDFNLLKLQFDLRGIRIQKLGQPSLPPLFRADEVKVNIPLSLILRRRLRIQDVEIVDPEILVQIDQHGQNNLPFRTGTEKSLQKKTTIPDFLIERFEVRNARISFIDAMNHLELELPDIWINGGGRDFGTLSFLLNMRKEGIIKFRSQNFPLKRLTLRAETDKEGLNIQELVLALSENEVELSGRLEDISAPFFEGDMQGVMNVEDFRSLTSIGDSFSGSVAFRSKVKGPLKKLEAQVGLRSEDLSFGEIGNIGMNAELSWKDSTLDVLSLELRRDKGEIRGQGTLHPFGWDEGNRMKVEWQNLDVKPIEDIIRIPYQVSTRTSGSLNISWDGLSLEDVSGECDVRFAPREEGEHSVGGAPLTGRVVAEVHSGRLETRLLDISILDAHLKGELQLHSDALSGNIRLEAQSIGRLTPLIFALSKNLDEKEVRRLGLDGPISLSATLGGDLKEPSARVELRSTNLRVLKANHLRIEGVARYDSLSFRIDSLLVEDGGGRIEITGSYPVKPSVQNMHFDIEGKALSVEKVMAILGYKELKAEGAVEVKATIEGRKDDLRIESKWTVSNVSLFEENFNRIDVDADYAKGRIICNSLRITGSKGTLETEGFYGLESREFRARLSTRSFLLEDIEVAEGSNRIRAELDMDLEAHGSVEAPHLQIKGEVHGLSIGGRDLADWRFEARSGEGEVLFKIEATLFSSVIDGSISLKKPYVLSADLAIDRMLLEDLRNMAPIFGQYDFSGLMTAAVRLKMDLEEPRKSLRCEAKIEQFQIKSKAHLIQNDGPILLSFESDNIHAEQLRLIGGGTHIEVKGSLPLNFSSSSKMTVSAGMDLSLLNDFTPLRDCKGSVTMESQLLGSISDLEATAVIEVKDMQFRSPRFPFPFDHIQARLKVEKNVLLVDSLTGRMAQSSFGLTGNVPFTSLPFSLPAEFHIFEERQAELVLHLENWDPSFLRTQFPDRILQQLKGTISGRIDLEGKKLLPADLSGGAVFETFDINFSGVSFKQDAPSRISMKKGMLSIETLSLRGGENRLSVKGTVDLAGGENLDLSLDGELSLGLGSIFFDEGVFAGKTRFQINIAPSYKNPEIRGLIDIQDASYHRLSPRILFEQISGRIEFAGGRAEIEHLQGLLNEGKTAVNGTIGLDGLTIQDVEMALKSENSLFDYPEGLRTQVSSELKLHSVERELQLTGSVTVLDARYSENFNAGTAVFNLLKRGSVQEILREPNPILKDMNLNINIGIPNNFIIDNNIVKAEVSADLKLVGTPYNPGLSGHASIAEGGELFFNQNTFSIEQGTVDFINPVRIEPELNLSARTQVQEYDIRLIVQGTPDNLTASLVSDPPLSEPNIISLLVTGRTLESASASVLSVAGSTALSYLNSAITGRIGQATARVLGLESVRIDAGLVSTEENPEARITIGQHLTQDLELVFSQDLKDARNRTWIVNYNPFKSFNIQGIKRDDNALNLALRQEIQFGLKPAPQENPAEKSSKKNLILENIRLEGEINLPESVIYKRLKLKKGKKLDFARFQAALERIRKLYRKSDYLSFSLTAKRIESDGRLDLVLHIDSGPKILLEYEGDSVPNKLKKEIVETWSGSFFGQLTLEDIKQRILAHYMERRYYQVQVKSEEKRGEGGERILIFKTLKGRKYHKPVIRIEGNRGLSERSIEEYLKKSGLMNRAFYKPTDLVKGIEDLYIRHGYLRPKVQLPVVKLEQDGRNASVEVPLEEGLRYKVVKIEFVGLRFFEEKPLLKKIGIHPGDIVSPERYNQLDQEIQEMYVREGFNDVRVRSRVQVNEGDGTVELNIDIQENQRWVIAEIDIEGNRMTDENIVSRALKFDTGDPVDFRSNNEARKRLYDLGIFKRVDIAVSPLEEGRKNPVKGGTGPGNSEKDCKVVIDVSELKPYRLRYGLQYDTETSFGVLADLVNRNFLGRAYLTGASFRLTRDERDARVFFRSPYFFSRKINTELIALNNRTKKPAFTLERTGFTLQQQMKISKSNVVSYNYTFEHIDTLYPSQLGTPYMDQTDQIGALNVAFTRDTRDDILNATRGMFLSQNLRYAPGFLGSKTRFIRYFGQYSTYLKLSDFLVLAASIRLGLGKGLNQDLPSSERFFAGGGTTIRGFKKDELGPRDPLTDMPQGGDAVFILNQELRFPLIKKFGGVVFLDLGNVYPKISDLDFLDIRKTAGFGFRLNTPFFLVRFDWGFKLDRRPGEALSQIFFSIGQAF